MPQLADKGTAADGDPARRVARFDGTERAVHWVTALIGLTLIATGAVLYVPALAGIVGRRLLVENLHLFVGLSAFAPVLIGALTMAGRQLRNDLRQMNRLTHEEIAWLRSAGRRGRRSIGKFNPGQKLNTYAIGGLLVVLTGTGVILRWGNGFPVGIRTGATFVHDLAAFGFAGLVVGHIGFALTHPTALRSMLRGWVPSSWAARHAPAWRPLPARVRTRP